MNNRHNDNQLNDRFDLTSFFDQPLSNRQKQYEAVRAIIKDGMLAEAVAGKFGYKTSTIYALVRDARSGKLDLFPPVPKGPRQRRTPSNVQSLIIHLRKENLSSPDIHQRLAEEGIHLSSRTIERILTDAGFAKLKRRTYKELGRSSKNKIVPDRSEHLDFSQLKPFKVDCPIVGIFFFLPYIIEPGIVDIVEKCRLPESSDISATSACLAMLLLKLIGNKRLSHMEHYDQEPGLGVFASLNVLPKSTYMSTYSCRTSEDMLFQFQKELLQRFRSVYPHFYSGDFINLDFHSIPHFGDESEMEKLWCGARGKALKGANTIFAQDAQSNEILYTRADILRKEE
ncbi:MAG: helix-turn-helix domain-containing protein, partial [Dehalococcoidia bacterium]